MKNKAFIFENKESLVGDELYVTRDYFSYYYNEIETLVKDNFNFFEFIRLDNNDKLELISYNRYGSENYTDLIIMINNNNFFNIIPYDTDIQVSIAESYNAYLTDEINKSRDTSKIAFIEDYAGKRTEAENSEKRDVLVPKVKNIQDVVSLLESYRDDNSDIGA